MQVIEITRLSKIELGLIDHLVEESLSQELQFFERLIREYRSGLNCFDQPDEILLKASVQGAVIGISGLNREPHLNDPYIGRLRHLLC
ncbi:hypothetical protein H6F86_17195 [Phormidium sp. FACHB-592]|uniref:GNAT family N-acetyltransferase n=1 Tax=Stenomitos frigidus AS-A4 TaxID=2933935 RepID=A0ABV0KSQ4_9CYAN|nr:hypothetical protein [Phormidium sp. FACHB-592]MBD2034407.1 hypothetical protein [Leptolyngbya sp. FACHB-321]MBD2075599.1 hypothetical protein [Phormidium sp. FACHB-592]